MAYRIPTTELLLIDLPATPIPSIASIARHPLATDPSVDLDAI